MRGRHAPTRGGIAAIANGWLVSLRIARREARRAKGRTALVVLMIALPVAALSFAAATYDMYRLTPEEQVTRQMGAADAIVRWDSDTPITMMPNGAMEVTEASPGLAAGQPPNETPHTLQRLLAQAPAGSTATPYLEGSVPLTTAHGIGSLNAYALDIGNPIAKGLVRVDDGRAPRSDDEVLASPKALARLGLQIGSTVTPSTPPGWTSMVADHPYTIVGTAELGGQLSEYVIFRPGAVAQATDNAKGVAEMSHAWLVSSPQPFTVARVNALGALGAQVTSRYLALNPPPGSIPDQSPQVAGYSLFGVTTVICGLGLFEVVLLAGPAFAVGARRRQRELALVAATGGTPATLRRIVLADGLVGGVAAAVVGLVIGLAVAFGTRPILENYLVHSRFGDYRVYPVAIVAVIGLALATGLLGALIPAVSAGRRDVVASLAGRTGETRSKRRWIGVGAVAVVVGAGVAVRGAYTHSSALVLAGLLIGQLGVVLWTPALLGAVSRIGRFLPLAPRIALRDTARRRASAAPAISAVMAAVAGSVALTVYMTASNDMPSTYHANLPTGTVYVGAQYPPGSSSLEAVRTAIVRSIPGAQPIEVTTADTGSTYVEPMLPTAEQCPFDPAASLSAAVQQTALADPRCDRDTVALSMFDAIVTDDPAVLRAMLGLQGSQLDNAVAALTAGKAVINDSRFVSGGQLQIDVQDQGGDTPTDSHQTVSAWGFDSSLATEIVLSPATAAALKIPTAVSVIASSPSVPTEAERDALTQTLIKTTGSGGVYVEDGPKHPKPIIPLFLAAAAGVIALGAAAIATGLAAVDGRRDLRTLGAIGARPSVRKRLALAQAGMIAGIGSVLGALVGFGAGAAVLFGLNQVWAGKWPIVQAPYPIEVPWQNLAISVIVVPLVAMLGAAILTRSRLPIERRPD